MGGSIRSESEAGKGSIFSFNVRLQVSPSDAVAPGQPVELRDLPVLVVDDNSTSRCLLREMLLGWGTQPTLASSGAEALRMLQEAAERNRPFALTLLDARMPSIDGFEVARQMPAGAGGPVLMLLASEDDAAKMPGAGMSARLVKPIRQSDLLETICTVLGPGAPAGSPLPAPALAPAVEPGGGLRVLLAEDNPFNQRLAVDLLEKRGHTVSIAANGQEAVTAVSAGTFDVVLMDVQMPQMGGFEATAAIRALERKSGGRLPIIGVTAHSMKGDRERCLEAGMDEYIAKPLRPKLLFAAITRLVGVRSREPLDAITKAVLDRVDGDLGFLRKLLLDFAEQAPAGISRIRDAVNAGDAAALVQAAHRFRGAARTFGPSELTEVAARLEQMGSAADLDGAVAAAARLDEAAANLVSRMRSAFDPRPQGVAAG